MPKRIIATAGAIAVMLTLTACAAEDRPSTGASSVVVRTIHVDGHAMQCAIYRPPNGGGIDCNWEAIP